MTCWPKLLSRPMMARVTWDTSKFSSSIAKFGLSASQEGRICNMYWSCYQREIQLIALSICSKINCCITPPMELATEILVGLRLPQHVLQSLPGDDISITNFLPWSLPPCAPINAHFTNFTFLMILSHFFSRMARLCVTWDSRRILAKTTTPVTCDRRIDYNGTVCRTVSPVHGCI